MLNSWGGGFRFVVGGLIADADSALFKIARLLFLAIFTQIAQTMIKMIKGPHMSVGIKIAARFIVVVEVVLERLGVAVILAYAELPVGFTSTQTGSRYPTSKLSEPPLDSDPLKEKLSEVDSRYTSALAPVSESILILMLLISEEAGENLYHQKVLVPK